MKYPNYDPASPLTPLSPEELDALDKLLARLPDDGAMSLDGMDGYLSALVVGPPQVLVQFQTGDWLPSVWGGDGLDGADGAAPFATQRQRKNTVVLLLRHLRHLHEQLHHAPASWEPIFSVAEQGADEWVDARDWCTGFLQAVDLQPEAWGGAWSGAELAPLLQLGGGLEGIEPGPTPDLDDPAINDGLSRAVPDLVLGLLARFQPPSAPAA